jgi:hypothetical protein
VSQLPNPRMQPTGRVGPSLALARPSQWPSGGSVSLCGREDDRLQLMRISLGGPAWRPYEGGSPAVAHVVGVAAMTELVLVASCVSSPPTSRDRKLLSLVGADAVSGWRCQPVGPRRLPTLWRRHEDCVAEERKADRLSGISVDRDPSGHVSTVSRTWGTHDSLVWQQLRDSLTAIVAVELAHGAHCATRLSAADSAHAALAPNWAVDSLWRLPAFDLRVALHGPKAGIRSVLWSITLEAFVSPLIACGLRRGPAA